LTIYLFSGFSLCERKTGEQKKIKYRSAEGFTNHQKNAAPCDRKSNKCKKLAQQLQ
jgi:hypothetical protein